MKLLLSIIFRTLIYVDDSSLQHHYTEASLCRKYADKELFAWFRARFLSLARSKLRLCSANHRAGYFSNLACDWLSIVWAYSEQETENGPWSPRHNLHAGRVRVSSFLRRYYTLPWYWQCNFSWTNIVAMQFTCGLIKILLQSTTSWSNVHHKPHNWNYARDVIFFNSFCKHWFEHVLGVAELVLGYLSDFPV